ncbi:gamma-glutamylcyclotransferase [Metapseudomonas resinovorans]|uniref:gamma-glutamylcyclotransferase family protein n=1 Tax=Metapseudomonas resinovorans TaxID=53412 RepID=UPI000985D121|nr:gamma-glutamylcyclotransferase family protein [Pseudomonas resinovorans]GLZ89456.1 gamma-glutamylcyclotransferase [Pseudomonas resinovorans]
MPFYFAYGSNMNPARMRSRGLAFSEALAGRLEGYALCFNKRAHDRPGRSYANIRYQRDGVVEGVLYRLEHEDEIWKMDPFEGTPIFYSRERMPVVTARGVQSAWVYVANPAMREDGLWPTRSYLEHLLAGREFLTPTYWENLAAVPAHADE